MWQRLMHTLWWLGLSIYFGGMLTLGAVVAPAVFSTAKTSALTMPGIESPPLSMSNEVGGEIFGAALNRFATVEWIALGLMLAALAGIRFAQKSMNRTLRALLILWALLFAVTLYDLGYLRPKVWELRSVVRQEAVLRTFMFEPAETEPEETWPNREKFAQLHSRAEILGQIEVYLLLAMLLLSAWTTLGYNPTKQKPTQAASTPKEK